MNLSAEHILFHHIECSPMALKVKSTIRPLSVYSPAVLVERHPRAGSCVVIKLSEDGILQFSSCLPLSHGHGDAWRSAQDRWQMKGNAQFISGASVVAALPIMRLQLASISYLYCTETLYHRSSYLFWIFRSVTQHRLPNFVSGA